VSSALTGLRLSDWCPQPLPPPQTLLPPTQDEKPRKLSKVALARKLRSGAASKSA